MLSFLIFASTAQHASPVSRSFPPQVRLREGVVLGGEQEGAEKGVSKRGAALYVPENGATNPGDGHKRFSRSWILQIKMSHRG